MAPCPKPLQRKSEVPDTPAYYGSVYHGEIGHAEAEEVLADTEDGTYLLRKSPGANDFYTLSMRFGGKTKNYKVYYKPGLGHFLKEEIKQFESINDLVADGLVDHYMRVHAAPIIQKMMLQTKNNYQQSPYMTLNRRKLRALSNDLQISVKKNIETEVKTCEIPSFPINQDETDTHEDDLPIVYEKPHTFKVHTFKGLNWCEFCANFLWGFTAQGVKCEGKRVMLFRSKQLSKILVNLDCGFIAHNKCSELVPAKCVPDLKRIRGVFGTDLTTLVTVHQCTIPFVVRCCVEEIEARGLLQEGIYRVSGFADEIEALKLALDKDGEKTNLSESAYGNVNVIAGVLKLYLRLLPVSLITFQAYPYFMASTRKLNTDNE